MVSHVIHVQLFACTAYTARFATSSDRCKLPLKTVTHNRLHSWRVICQPYKSFLQKPQTVEDSTSTEPLLVSGLDGLRVLDLSECRLTQWEQSSRSLCTMTSCVTAAAYSVHRYRANVIALYASAVDVYAHMLNSVAVFARLPALASLSLNHNAIAAVGEINSSTDFTALESLQLHGCALPDWHGIDALNSLAALKALRFGAAPVTKEMGTGESRATVIARLPQLIKVQPALCGCVDLCACSESNIVTAFRTHRCATVLFEAAYT
eukprot:19269-Heterococcus_DN1.PRE.2